MKFTATLKNGEVVEGHFEGENFALGLAAVKHTCGNCGAAQYVDGGDTRKCPCGVTYQYEDDDSEQLGYLHVRDGD